MKTMPRLFKTRYAGFLVEIALALRAVLFVGRRFTCPCCRWRLRAFTHGGWSLRPRHHGYCPRCNAKARHRRDWLYLEHETNLFSDQLRLLHVSPKFSLSRRFTRMANLDYVAMDLNRRPNTNVIADAAELPFRPESFDAIICIHVLEHVADDRRALQEFFRVLKPGGWAVITVPIRLDRDTYEDASITSPEERKLAFGESAHVRFYGRDMRDRLQACGFTVRIDLAENLDGHTVREYGLLADENVFHCVKPPVLG